ncbi:MAG: hypothetical protein EU542_05305 [Promethearchaeota archaeon]|nr:MAG: hypothetical protein EU542_05305 [Candidatus Lokiarchaeota archaeon]
MAVNNQKKLFNTVGYLVIFFLCEAVGITLLIFFYKLEYFQTAIGILLIICGLLPIYGLLRPTQYKQYEKRKVKTDKETRQAVDRKAMVKYDEAADTDLATTTQTQGMYRY